MTSFKTDEIARRLWQTKDEEERQRKLSYLSSTGSSEMDDEIDIKDEFQSDETDKNYIEKKHNTSDDSIESTNSTNGKPTQSYIALIATAILKSKTKRLVLSDIYKYIMDHYPYFQNQDKSWRNSIRHNLSLNECFIKVGRSEHGKGHYWAIHPANYEDFSVGDFRRRRARRRVRRSFLDAHAHPGYNRMQPYSIARPYYESDFMAIPRDIPREAYTKKYSEADFYPRRFIRVTSQLNLQENKNDDEEKTQLGIFSTVKKHSTPTKKISTFTIENILNLKENKQDTLEKHLLKSPLKVEQFCSCEMCEYREKHPSFYRVFEKRRFVY